MNYRKLIGIAQVFLFTVLLCASTVKAEEKNEKFAVGLNYPGLSLRYDLGKRFSIEGKGQLAEGVNLFGLRGYYFLKNRLFFTGVEIDYASFEGNESEGSGIAAELFAGMEYFINKRLSFQADLGPALIMLSDKNYEASETGLEFVLNLGVNLHF